MIIMKKTFSKDIVMPKENTVRWTQILIPSKYYKKVLDKYAYFNSHKKQIKINIYGGII